MNSFYFLKFLIAFQKVFVHITYDLGEMCDDVKASHHTVLLEKGTEVFFWKVSEFYYSVGLEKNPLHQYF